MSIPSAPAKLAQQRSRATVEGVLDAALEVLVEQGSQGFSVRKVAQRAGLAVGNVQYYYPSRDDLIEALCRRIVERFSARACAVLVPKMTPEQAILEFVDLHFTDLDDALGSVPVWELAALAAHDGRLAGVMFEFYRTMRIALATMIGRARPHLSATRAANLATVIVGMVEGSGFFDAYGRPRRAEFAGLRDEIRRVVRLLISEGS